MLSLPVSPEENMKHELAPTSFRVLYPRAVGELSMDGTYFYSVIYGGFLEQTGQYALKKLNPCV